MNENVVFASADARLTGTLSWPDALVPVPGVVLIGGSGPADRHNDGLFDALRDYLVDAGVAVLAYDKRGVGGSTGAWPTATVDGLASDASAAVEVLRRHPRVATNNVGALGHSEGAWVALRLCAQLGDLRHLIVNSCPATSFLDAEVFALTAAGAEPGEAVQLYRRLSTTAVAGAGVAEGQRILASYEHLAWYASVLDGFTLNADTWAQLRSWADFDPYLDLTRVTTPTLATFGENDPFVPVATSVAVFEQTAKRAARSQQVAVLPGADHRICINGNAFAPGYLTLLSRWCADPLASRL